MELYHKIVKGWYYDKLFPFYFDAKIDTEEKIRYAFCKH